MTRSLPPEWDDDRRSGDGGDPQGNLAPTDWKVIIVAALCGAALGWFALSIYKINDATVPILPWSLPVVILVAAIATWGYARVFRAKVVDPEREVEASQGLVSLALGKAIALSGAAFVGACIVYVLTFVWHLNIPYPRQRVIVSGVTAVTCAVLAWTGWFLENACKVPRGPEDPDKRPKG
ncbi:DUF3180 domain-containing protein [uncultured Cutibacterium sp.]|uniref:DUF3180 domain-containing protein n=1 Tax=uncultured Cutibacterium sp. TaxID=1912223 RepID=UPI002597B7BB|nr:DUF3180 domain-containing protein [uncultured Cutibacterium sp.]